MNLCLEYKLLLIYFDCHMIWILFWWVNEAWGYIVFASYDLVGFGRFPQRLCRLVGPAKLVQVVALICNRFSLCCFSLSSFRYFTARIWGSLAFVDFVSVYHSFNPSQHVNVCLHNTLKVSGLCLFVPQLNHYSVLLSLTLLNIKHKTDACRVRICIWLFGFSFSLRM